MNKDTKLVLIMGVPGSGKSKVRKELSLMGYESYDSDHGFSRWEDKSGNPVQSKSGDEAWEEEHDWNIDFDKVKHAQKKSDNEVVFLCANAGNLRDGLHFFDEAILLDLSEDTLLKRLNSRSKSYGKEPFQQKQIAKWLKDAPGEWLEKGAVVVNSDQDIKKVIKDILSISAPFVV